MTDEELFTRAIAIAAKAHVPYSKFRVGAALTTTDGRMYAGANIENASYPEGWCAETSAIAHMVCDWNGTIDRIAVYSPNLAEITPCGGCRQRIAEFAHPETVILLGDDSGPTRKVTISDLLPFAFSDRALRGETPT
ncbi:MAG: cytidine deaminase [Pseudomonadota bacterium]